jgi:hypothetical protein
MMKFAFAAAVAATICVTDAAAQSLVQRSDWQDRKFETYLPKPAATVPWLAIDTKTKLPKGDIPLGRYADVIGPLLLQPKGSNIRISSNAHSGRRMP